VDPGDPLAGVAVDHELTGLGPAVVDRDGQPLREAAFDQVAWHGVLHGVAVRTTVGRPFARPSVAVAGGPVTALLRTANAQFWAQRRGSSREAQMAGSLIEALTEDEW
jgi:hypothetical protein